MYYNGYGCSSKCPAGTVNLALAADYIYANKSNSYNNYNYNNDNNQYGYISKVYGGVCIKCPYKCAACATYDGKYRATFLLCLKCYEGYTLQDGVCSKLCQFNNNNNNINNNNIGNSLQ